MEGEMVEDVELALHVAAGFCAAEVEAYPHPGCAEFGPPDVWLCTNTATWEETHNVMGEVMVIRVCDDHQSGWADQFFIKSWALWAL